MKAEDASVSAVSWILIYRAGERDTDFHQVCDGMGKCVVVVKAANVRTALPLPRITLPTSMDLLSLLKRMVVEERYSNETMIAKWESGMILLGVQ
jgi:hypothetical protein